MCTYSNESKAVVFKGYFSVVALKEMNVKCKGMSQNVFKIMN